MFAGIEAGGTKFVCGVGTGPNDLVTATVPTTTPAETLPKVIEFFRSTGHDLKAIGIGSFGPVDLDEDSPSYGHVTSTPKPGWAHSDLRGAVQRALNLPVAFDTDVAAAALGEARWGAARGLADALYITIGTGIGGGAIVNGKVVHGLVHPEMGHLHIPRDAAADPYAGCCPYHGNNCFEGLACGPAIEQRWGMSAKQIPEGHPAWDLEARYIALGVVNIVLTISPKRVILGGGVMQTHHIFPKVRAEFVRLLNGYLKHPAILDGAAEYIVPPQLGSNAGVLGCLVLAENALQGVTA